MLIYTNRGEPIFYATRPWLKVIEISGSFLTETQWFVNEFLLFRVNKSKKKRLLLNSKLQSYKARQHGQPQRIEIGFEWSTVPGLVVINEMWLYISNYKRELSRPLILSV